MCFRESRKEDAENGSPRKMEWERGALKGRDSALLAFVLLRLIVEEAKRSSTAGLGAAAPDADGTS